MTTLPTIDAGTLGWVKSEIEDTAAQARELLGRYESDPSDSAAMRMCATHLHQVYGTLTMVELDGAARLVHECERLAQGVADGNVEWRGEVGGALKRAIDDLSSYLEGLQSSPVPSPLKLVEPINRVLEVRGAETVSELELFSPDLSARPPEATAQANIDATLFLKLADDLRMRFERALLSALRNPGDRAPFNEFRRVFNNLVAIDRRGSLRQLWWIGAGLSEALADGSLEVDERVRGLLARINEQLKSLKDKSQAGRRRAPPDELIKRALLTLAYCGSDASTVQRIREAFDLDEWIDKSASRGLPDIESLSTALVRFTSEAEIDLEQAQNLLARYFSPQGAKAETLDRLVSRLDALKVAAERNDLGVFVRLVDALANVAEEIRADRVRDFDQASMQMAGALLFIQDSGAGIRPGPEWQSQAEASIAALESITRQASATAGEAARDPIPAAPMPVPGDNAARAAATEVRSELQYVEHALEQVAGGEAQAGRLRGVEAHLKRIEGTLEILDHGPAAALAERLRTGMRTLVENDSVSTRGLDAFAMAVGTLGLCADEIGAGSPPQRMQPAIDRAIEELGQLLGDEEAPSRPVHLELVRGPGASSPDDRGERRDAVDPPLPLELDDANTDDGHDPLESLGLDLDFEDDFDADTGDQPPPVAAVDDDPGEEDELVGIFFEEASEIEPQIADSKAAWRAHPDDESALRDLRRGFHTLKGSGRFAGATSIAELSWVTEDLLNAVIEGEAAATAEIHDFVDRAHEEVARRIARRDVGDELDLAPWRARAAALKAGGDRDDAAELSRGLGAELLELESAGRGAEAPVAPSATAPKAGDGSRVNEVFFNELEGHIRVIADHVAEARRKFPDWEISEPLTRTAHTLRGVFRSVGLAAPARMADGLDDLLAFKKRQRSRLEEVDLVLIDQSGRLMRFAVNKLDGELAMTADLSMQFEELAAAFGQRLRYLGAGDEFAASPPVSPAEPARGEAPERASAEDEELLQAFREEAQEILARLDQQVGRWRDGAPASQALSAMRRELHTFKGGARAVGWTVLGDLAHNTETLLENEPLTTRDPGAVSDIVREMHDLSMVAVSAAAAPVTGELERLNQRVLDLDAGIGEPAVEIADFSADSTDEGAPASRSVAAVDLPEAPAAPLTAVMEGGESRAVRVRTEVLDELVSYAGEVSILRSRLQQQIAMVRSNLGELSDTVRQFREQLRDLEIESESQMLATHERIREEGGVSDFDPLELDRFSRLQTVARQLGESVGSLTAIQAGISEFAGDAENTLQQQRHLSDSLQEGLLRTRMISFVALVPRLRHLTRQTAGELGRSINLVVSGEQVEVDRKVLDQMSASFEHMIRNAAYHGIENAADRTTAGKSATGTISIGVEQDGNDIVIRIGDDGRGLDLDAIGERARAIGLLPSGQSLGDDDLIRVLAAPGLSTAGAVTQVSGRGVGMDVVSEMVRQLGGSIAVETERGRGTTFILRVPVTLAVSHALLVYAGEQMFAVPARLIVNVLRLKRDDIDNGDTDADAYTYYNDRRIPVLNLARRLGLPFRQNEGNVAHVIVVRAGLREIGLMVESISDTREVVVKPLGPLLQSIPGIGAVTLLGDGSIVLILDVPDLWQTRRTNVTADAYAVAAPTTDNVTVMVVDDSMTVRNVMGRDLQNNGFEVILAKDGVDAIEQLRHTVPDILLVDLEMPRMDGFELTRRVRADANLVDVPILVITSRAGSRHRDQAERLGANGYMSKPYRLDELVNTIHSLTGEASASETSVAPAETLH